MQAADQMAEWKEQQELLKKEAEAMKPPGEWSYQMKLSVSSQLSDSIYLLNTFNSSLVTFQIIIPLARKCDLVFPRL